jgi:hypothetical protein
MPTLAEIIDLISATYTNFSWTASPGGATIIPKTGDTGKELWLPAPGHRIPDGTASQQGTAGYCWSSTLYETKAYRLGFYTASPTGTVVDTSKLYAFSVRCVRTVQ